MNTIRLTKENIEACESLTRSYTWETIRLLTGEPTRKAPIGGWKLALIGKEIPMDRYLAAKEARSKKAKAAELPMLPLRTSMSAPPNPPSPNSIASG